MSKLRTAIRNRKTHSVGTLEAILLQEVYQKVETIVDAEHSEKRKLFEDASRKVAQDLKALAVKLASETTSKAGKDMAEAIAGIADKATSERGNFESFADSLKKELQTMVADAQKLHEKSKSEIDKYRGPQGKPGDKGDPGDPGKNAEQVTKEELMAEIMPEIQKMKRELTSALRTKKESGGGGMGNAIPITPGS